MLTHLVGPFVISKQMETVKTVPPISSLEEEVACPL